MNLDFSSEDLAFREEVRAFLKANLPERVRAQSAQTPGIFVEPDVGSEWHRILYEKGWIAYHWPVDCGGCGWNPVQRYIFEKECAIAGAPALSVMSLRLLGPVVCEFGTDEQKQRFLPPIRSGEDYWCQGYSEPGSGSDLASLRSTAKRDDDEYVVNGSKIWTTHAHHANWIFALVRTDSNVRKQAGISFLLIPMDQPGVEVAPIVTMGGDHEVNQVFFDNARTSVDNLVGEEGQGWTIAKFLLENERGGACHAPQIIKAVDELAAAHAHSAHGNGKVSSATAATDHKIARLRLDAMALEGTELRILAEMIKGQSPGPQTSLVKLIASELRQKVDRLALDIFGYDALQFPEERPLYGHNAPPPTDGAESQVAAARFLNGRAWSVFGGSSEVQKNIIAKTVLGL